MFLWNNIGLMKEFFIAFLPLQARMCWSLTLGKIFYTVQKVMIIIFFVYLVKQDMRRALNSSIQDYILRFYCCLFLSFLPSPCMQSVSKFHRYYIQNTSQVQPLLSILTATSLIMLPLWLP